MTALVGHSGSGKSTMLNMVPRIYSPTDGNITIDNQDISQCSLHSLRNNIGLVTQETTMFNDTIEANIQYGNSSASLEEINGAIKKAGIDEFVNSLPDKYTKK